jgi:hypothetical protein
VPRLQREARQYGAVTSLAAGEIFGFVVMGAGAYALICWFAFTLRNLTDALDYTSDDIAYGDWPKVPDDFRGVKADRQMAAGGRLKEPIDLRGNQQSHCSVPASHSGTGGK